MTRQPYNHGFRLDRALQHFHSLEAEHRRWRQRGPYEMIQEFDPQTGKKLVRVKVLEQPPALLGLLISDCLHNLRSALDNLVYDLLVAHYGDPPPSKFAKTSEFPIFGKPISTEARQKRIGGIHPDAQAVIEELQPYQRGNPFAADPLWLLSGLSNIDKHRVPHISLLTVPTAFAFFVDSETGGPVGTTSMEWIPGIIENSAIIARYMPDPDYPDAEMQVNFTSTFGIAFGNKESVAYGLQVIPTLKLVGWHIKEFVIPPLLPYLP